MHRHTENMVKVTNLHMEMMASLKHIIFSVNLVISIATKAPNLIFYTGAIFKISSRRETHKKKSIISDSLMGTEGRELSLMFLSVWVSLIGIHSLSVAFTSILFLARKRHTEHGPEGLCRVHSPS